MIRVLIQYPVGEDVRFDIDYYRDVHVPLVQSVMTPLGMIKGEWDEIIPHPAAGGIKRYHVISVQYWESLQAMEAAYTSPQTVKVKQDVQNFFSGAAVRVISQVHS